jgi:hypothetical protein
MSRCPLPNAESTLTDGSKGRPMTMMERAKRFPVAVQQLYKDWLLYRNIEDASRTSLNAWTVDHPLHKGTAADELINFAANVTHVSLFSLTNNDTTPRPGRIPRRQLEQQRRLRSDLAVVSPLVLVWLLPIIGYLPMILAFIAPRQVLSRHFWNDFEIQHYRKVELEQRRFVYSRLAELFMEKAVKQTSTVPLPLVNGERDIAGPLLDLAVLWDVFLPKQAAPGAELAGDAVILKPQYKSGAMSSLDALSRDYLVQLALAIGIHQRLPPGLANVVTQYTLTPILKWRIRQRAQAIVQDDAMLIQEQQEGTFSWDALTDDEVQDACLLRGLPVDSSIMDMRTALDNHVKMVRPLHERMYHAKTSMALNGSASHIACVEEGLGLLTLHLPILRDFCQRQQKVE